MAMDPDREEAEVFSDQDEPVTEEEEDEEDEDEEEDAKIFSAWMQQYRTGEPQRRRGEGEQEQQQQEEEEEEEEEGGEAEGGRASSRSSRSSLEAAAAAMRVRMERRASLPCPATLSAMQLARLHSSTQAPVTARTLLRRSSSRRLLPPLEEPGSAPSPAPERRPSLIPTIPEATEKERKVLFRRRTVMSMSDADRVCLICHDDLNKGGSGTRELQCSHTFHQECIEEWLWRKQSCPTCRVQVSVPQPLYWGSTRVKVP